MTVAFRPRSRPRPDAQVAVPTVDLSHEGIHRDPANHDPIATGGFAQRLVHRASTALGGGRSTRRSFLTRTAVIGSALAVGPMDFILKPGTAYGYVCGSCTEGWTAFCCTINGGRNSCPPNSFVAGWWKADNAAYCCGRARYIIDCNASCPTQCSCRCAGGSCDNRKTCCNQFRYGQCHQEISCYGPVVCRVATCTVPWLYDPSCTTSSATDNRTRDHGAPCLTTDCGTAIDKKHQALGGDGGFLGPPTGAEGPVGDGRGARRRYTGGNIYWTPSTGAHEVHGAILTEYDRLNGPFGGLKYPTSDELGSADGRARYSSFEGGRIYFVRSTGRSWTLSNSFVFKYESLGGVGGILGYPTSNIGSAPGGAAYLHTFERGRIYHKGGSNPFALHGATLAWHQGTGGPLGLFGYPISDLLPTDDPRARGQFFERGIAWSSAPTGCHGLRGGVLDRYVANGHVKSLVGLPTSDTAGVGDGRGTFSTFERYGIIYALGSAIGYQVQGTVLAYYLERGGPRGALGYPTSELTPAGFGQRRYQSFERGRVEVLSNGDVVPA